MTPSPMQVPFLPPGMEKSVGSLHAVEAAGADSEALQPRSPEASRDLAWKSMMIFQKRVNPC